MANISAEQHNMARRATKAKRKSGSGGGKQQHEVEEESVLTMAIRERRQREWIETKKAENRERLLKQLDEKMFLEFSLDTVTYYEDEDSYKMFNRNVRDIKAAIKELPHDQRRQYQWSEGTDKENAVSYFRVAKIRRR